MADEELFAADEEEELASEFEEIEEIPPRKGSWLKRLFIILLLLIIIAGALFGLNWFGYIDLPIDEYLPVEQLMEGSSNTVTVEPEPEPAPLPPPPAMPLAPENKVVKPAVPKPVSGYYLKVGSCLYKKCLKEISNKMKELKLPVAQTKNVQITTYFEVISDSSYLRKRAEEKLRLLNKYNETVGFPYLLKTRNGRYVISFGQFPQKTSAMQMKSQLEHLYPQVRMRFALRPRKDQATITKMYAGPFSKKEAESTRMKLRDSFEFEWIEIVKFP